MTTIDIGLKLKYRVYRYYQAQIAKHGAGNSNGILKRKRMARKGINGWGVRRRAYITHIVT